MQTISKFRFFQLCEKKTSEYKIYYEKIADTLPPTVLSLARDASRVHQARAEREPDRSCLCVVGGVHTVCHSESSCTTIIFQICGFQK
jgi:hypothetical protein